MQCYNCNEDLIWGGDHDAEEDQDHNIVTNLSCPTCNSFVIVYWDKKENIIQGKNNG
jgi:formate dehydrogenase maturation protein FdhE